MGGERWIGFEKDELAKVKSYLKGIVDIEHKENWGDWKSNSTGRWPANLILQHLDGCKESGSKKVKSSTQGHGTTTPYGSAATWNTSTTPDNQRNRWHAGPDGTETITSWDCKPGCPVAALDEQSGSSASAIRRGGEGASLDPSQESWRFKRVEGGFEDKGGASRFFKQVQRK